MLEEKCWDTAFSEEENLCITFVISKVNAHNKWFYKSCERASERFGVPKERIEEHAKPYCVGAWRQNIWDLCPSYTEVESL